MLAFLRSLACNVEWWLSRNQTMYTAHDNLSEDLVPVLETLKGDEHRPGAPHLRAGVDSTGLGYRHFSLDTHVSFDQGGNFAA